MNDTSNRREPGAGATIGGAMPPGECACPPVDLALRRCDRVTAEWKRTWEVWLEDPANGELRGKMRALNRRRLGLLRMAAEDLCARAAAMAASDALTEGGAR